MDPPDDRMVGMLAPTPGVCIAHFRPHPPPPSLFFVFVFLFFCFFWLFLQNACIELWDKNMANVNAPFAKESKRVKKLQKRQKGEVSAEQE